MKKSYECKKFGLITVYTQEKDILHFESKVTINWACVGETDILEAENFYRDFGKALKYAKNKLKNLKEKKND